MKLNSIIFALLVAFSGASYAYQCNTVMGGCPTDNDQIGSGGAMPAANKKLVK